MKIAFWSPIPGGLETTAGILSTSIFAALEFGQKVLVAQTHYTSKFLEYALLGRELNEELLNANGIDELIRCYKTIGINAELIENVSISFMRNSFHLLTGTTSRSKEIFDGELMKHFPQIYQTLNQYYDMVFIDVPPGFHKVSSSILKESDIIVVILSQNRYLLDYYLTQNLISNENTLFLISHYDKDSKYNQKNLEKSYPFLRNKTIVLPYSTGFMDAMSEGKSLQYLIKSMMNANGSYTSPFLNSIRKNCELLTNQKREKEEIIC